MSKYALNLDGENLKVQDLFWLTKHSGVSVEIPALVLATAVKAHEFLMGEIDRKIIYGVNTGFGPMASRVLARNQLESLQKNLILSHAAGLGSPVPGEYVLAAMAVRLNTFAKGFSGVSPELLERLQKFINSRIIPLVPEHGAVGTSGDLVQLAHIALALIGGGEVEHGGEKQSAAKVIKKLGLGPYRLKPKEGLALINGTSMMAGVAAHVSYNAKRLLSLATRSGGLALELVRAQDDSISERLHAMRPHPGQAAVAKKLRGLLAGSKLLSNRSIFRKLVNSTTEVKEISAAVQEIYSFRCIPQILGPVHDILAKVWKEVEVEINSATDNPLVDWKKRLFLHGGNFHGDYIAAGMDQLKMAVVKLTMLSERRINFFLNSALNRSYPPFLNLKVPGLTLGLQGLQFVATSTTAQSQTLAFPQSVHSIPTNADNQDVVSMGTDAALLAAKVAENAYAVLAIELVTLAQAAEFLKQKNKFSKESRKLLAAVRKFVPRVEEDRVLAGDVGRLVDHLKNVDDLDLDWVF